MPTTDDKNIFLDTEHALVFDPSISYAKWDMADLFNLYDQPIQIGIYSAQIYNFFINISAAVGNNNIRIITPGAVAINLVIPDGFYSISKISEMVDLLLTNVNSAYTGMVSFLPIFACNKCAIKFLVAGWSINWLANSFYALVGFGLGVITAPSDLYTFLSPNEVNLNIVSLININTNLSNDTLNDGIQSSIIAQVPVDVDPGDLINYNPGTVLMTKTITLSSSCLNYISVQLTNGITPLVSTYGFKVCIKLKSIVDMMVPTLN